MIKIGNTKPINVIWDLIKYEIWDEITEKDKKELINKLTKEEKIELYLELKLRGIIE